MANAAGFREHEQSQRAFMMMWQLTWWSGPKDVTEGETLAENYTCKGLEVRQVWLEDREWHP